MSRTFRRTDAGSLEKTRLTLRRNEEFRALEALEGRTPNSFRHDEASIIHARHDDGGGWEMDNPDKNWRKDSHHKARAFYRDQLNEILAFVKAGGNLNDIDFVNLPDDQGLDLWDWY